MKAGRFAAIGVIQTIAIGCACAATGARGMVLEMAQRQSALTATAKNGMRLAG